jgi:hypothetical protein
MNFKLSKLENFPRKKKVALIISTVLFVIFSFSGGYLLWRVRQPETIAPEDIEAIETIICYGDGVNEDLLKSITTYNIKNGGLPYSVGPFPKGARVVLYYKSLLGSNYKPKLRFSYKGQNYDYAMPSLDSNRRAVVQTNIIIANQGDSVSLVYSDDNNNQGNPSCNPGDTKYRSFGWMAVNSGNTCGSGFWGPPTTYLPKFEKISVSGDIQWANSFDNPIVSRQCWADWREWLGDYDFNDYFLQIGYIPPVEPECGNNAKGYTSRASSFPNRRLVDFCKEGDLYYDGSAVNPQVVPFPNAGGDVEWTCKQDGHEDEVCVATRENFPPECGDNAKNYSSEETSYLTVDQGGFCEEGEIFYNDSLTLPFNIPFPDPGGDVEWLCKQQGQEDVACLADRDFFPPECGEREGFYKFTDIDWRAGGWCSEGNIVGEEPDFPDYGESLEWECEQEGHRNVKCEAERDNIPPLCGDLAVNYEEETSSWPEGEFCGVGKVVGSNPTFPRTPGSEVSWECESGTHNNVECSAKLLSSPPLCGSRARSYLNTETEWGDGDFCSVGSLVGSQPVFPEEGQSVSWECEKDIHDNITCTASKQSPVQVQQAPPPPQQAPREETKVPETGIFDDTKLSLIIGGVLILLGFTWISLGRGVYGVFNLLGRFPIKAIKSVKEVRENLIVKRKYNQMKKQRERRKKFEKRVDRKL